MASDKVFSLPRGNRRWVVKSKAGLYMAYDYSLFTENIEIAALFMYPHLAERFKTDDDRVVRVIVNIHEAG